MTTIKITERLELEQAMKMLKKKLLKEGLFKELKDRRFFEKPSKRKKRKLAEAVVRRKRKNKSRRKRYS